MNWISNRWNRHRKIILREFRSFIITRLWSYMNIRVRIFSIIAIRKMSSYTCITISWFSFLKIVDEKCYDVSLRSWESCDHKVFVFTCSYRLMTMTAISHTLINNHDTPTNLQTEKWVTYCQEYDFRNIGIKEFDIFWIEENNINRKLFQCLLLRIWKYSRSTSNTIHDIRWKNRWFQ